MLAAALRLASHARTPNSETVVVQRAGAVPPLRTAELVARVVRTHKEHPPLGFIAY
jgi:hypothetical protein